MKLIYVEWVDAYGVNPEWREIEGREPEPLLCRSIGWLTHEDDKCIVVTPHLSAPSKHPQQGCGDMTIPVVSIKNRRDVKVEDALSLIPS